MLLGFAPLGSLPIGAAPGVAATQVFISGTALTVGPGRASAKAAAPLAGKALTVGPGGLRLASPLSMTGEALIGASAYSKTGTLKLILKGLGLLTPEGSSRLSLKLPPMRGFAISLTSQAFASVALSNSLLPIFPVLLPLAWSVHKKPIMASRVITAVTGRETQLAAAAYPRWAFTLTYGGSSWLREQTQNIIPDPTKFGFTEFEQLSALFIFCQGPYGEFYYEDPDDNSRLKAPIGNGNGLTTSFPIYVPWGFGPLSPSFFYPVGGVKTIDTVYFNGIIQPTSAYGLDATKTQLNFASAPSFGTIITADFYFYFRCRFLDDHLDFSQWAQNLWECPEVRFESVKV